MHKPTQQRSTDSRIRQNHPCPLNPSTISSARIPHHPSPPYLTFSRRYHLAQSPSFWPHPAPLQPGHNPTLRHTHQISKITESPSHARHCETHHHFTLTSQFTIVTQPRTTLKATTLINLEVQKSTLARSLFLFLCPSPTLSFSLFPSLSLISSTDPFVIGHVSQVQHLLLSNSWTMA